jgi:hypothetical protein
LWCIHCPQEHARTWPDWRPKLSFFTPVGTELKFYWQCPSSSESQSQKFV